ncbi:MAG: aldolase [Bryobacterales bacterium]|nr:aldolase [Bryobacterales bacterium]
MKPNRLQQVVAEGRLPVGHMLWEFHSPGVAHMVANAGADFVLIDMEHSGFSNETVAALIGWFKATTVAPFVRVPQTLYHFIARAMDAGALGIMNPNVETPEQARALVDAVKFAPHGKRGVGIGTAHTDWKAADPDAYFGLVNRNTTVIAQIESVTGMENLEAIAATPGIDILWVGHFDLSQSMGIPGRFHDPRFLEALRRVPQVARAHGKLAGIQPGSLDQAAEWTAAGYGVISYGADAAVYSNALASGIGAVRAITRP